MIIETNRLRLRNYKETDIDDYFEYVSQPNVGPKCGWEPYTSKEEALKRLKLETSKPYQFAIELKENSKVIGAVEIMSLENNEKFPFLNDVSNTRELGFIMNENYWNKGYMTEAVEIVIATCFEVLNYDAVVAANYEPNPASGKVQEKCGMKYMGKLKNHVKWYLTGEMCDVLMHMITKEEYNRNKTDKEIVIMH